LAMTLAAAIAALVPSPRTTASAGWEQGGICRPSASTRSGTGCSRATARAIACKEARRMSVRSISTEEIAQALQVTALARISSYKSRRLAAVSFLLSSRPEGHHVGGRTTAAATTGPAQQPRPASSTPASRHSPGPDFSWSNRTRGLSRSGTAATGGLRGSWPYGRCAHAGSTAWPDESGRVSSR